MSTAIGMEQMMAEQSPPLPQLREDLQLLESAPMEDGAPAWLLYDPLRNAYFQLGLASVQLLNHWRVGMPTDEFTAQLAELAIDVDAEQVNGFIRFLQANQLLVVSGDQGRQSLITMKAQRQKSWWSWLVHNYLFIKIPLWRPDLFLERTLPWVEFCFDARFVWLIRLLGLIGIVLAMRQWQSFSNTFLHFFSWQGLGLYAVTLVGLKAAHELGHAYTAKRLGSRVASIGIAFLVMFPMLYTDTTDAWRLKRKQDRLRIVLAGIKTEVHLALLATFLWSFLPDGPARSVAFFVATTSWLTSLAVNISPFMRFDGYFALADILGAKNLQPRAFAMARWRLREWLFGFKDPAPEYLPAARKHLFIWYAWGTWVYRFFLFLGIALLVYYFAFKVLGIVLFLVEIVWFILLPIWREIMVWWERKEDMKVNRQTLTTLIVLGALIGLAVVPWQGRIMVPAVMAVQQERHVYAPEHGQIADIAVSVGELAENAQPLLHLANQEIGYAIEMSNIEMASIEHELKRLAATSRSRDQRQVLEQQLKREQQNLNNLLTRQQSLQVYAPAQGKIEINESLSQGQWVAKDQLLLTIINNDSTSVTALLSEKDLGRVRNNTPAYWQSDREPSIKHELTITHIAPVSEQVLKWPELSSAYGGDIATRTAVDGNEGQRPEEAVYRIDFTLAETVAVELQQRQLGVVHLQAEPVSWAQRWYEHVVAVLIRESGF